DSVHMESIAIVQCSFRSEPSGPRSARVAGVSCAPSEPGSFTPTSHETRTGPLVGTHDDLLTPRHRSLGTGESAPRSGRGPNVAIPMTRECPARRDSDTREDRSEDPGLIAYES